MAKITAERLRELLEYNADTGVFTWRSRLLKEFESKGHSAAHTHARWNTRYAGAVAGTTIKGGYRCICVDYCREYEHRLAWLYVTGEYPPIHIDHENGVRHDNRFENLRAVSEVENHRNQRLRSTNTSGVMGVLWHTQRGKWNARIMVDGKNISLGLYVDKDEAIAVRRAAEVKYGFHANHGSLPVTSPT